MPPPKKLKPKVPPASPKRMKPKIKSASPKRLPPKMVASMDEAYKGLNSSAKPKKTVEIPIKLRTY